MVLCVYWCWFTALWLQASYGSWVQCRLQVLHNLTIHVIYHVAVGFPANFIRKVSVNLVLAHVYHAMFSWSWSSGHDTEFSKSKIENSTVVGFICLQADSVVFFPPRNCPNYEGLYLPVLNFFLNLYVEMVQGCQGLMFCDNSAC